MDISECLACTLHWDAHPMIVEACASVAIENGDSTASATSGYFSSYHERGHPELAADEQKFHDRDRPGQSG